MTGLVEYSNFFADIVANFSSFFDVITEKSLLGHPILYWLFGGALSMYVGYVIASWILDFVT